MPRLNVDAAVPLVYKTTQLFLRMDYKYIEENTMYLHDSIETNTHTRVRKGKPDTYTTKKTLHHFKCDNCSNIFTRPKNGKRRDKRDVHFCPTCPAYSLAQKETVTV